MRRLEENRLLISLLQALMLLLVFEGPALAETLPLIDVADVAVLEGNSGTTNLAFKLVLSKPSSRIVMADYATRDVSAIAGLDYSAAFGVAIFEPGSTQRDIIVSINGDLLNEADETFWLTLARPINAKLSRDHAVGTILNDDPLPTISIKDSPRIQAVERVINATFKVNLSSPSGQTITVDHVTRNGTAHSGRDFVPVADTLTFTPGTTEQTLVVPVTGNSFGNGSNGFFVVLTNAVNAKLLRNEAVCTIVSKLPSLAMSGPDGTRRAATASITSLRPESRTAIDSASQAAATFRSSLVSEDPRVPTAGLAQSLASEANIALESGASTNFIHVEQPLNFTLTVINTGSTKAEAVIVTNLLPLSATCLSLTLSQGSYDRFKDMIVCKFGELLPGAHATAVALVRFGAAGLATNSAVVTHASAAARSAKARTSLVVYVTNDLPIISEIRNQTTAQNTASRPIPFTVSDSETAPDHLIVLAASSNTRLVPDSNLILDGKGANRSLIIIPARDELGDTVITLSAFDADGGVADESFKLRVEPSPDGRFVEHIEREQPPVELHFQAKSGYLYDVQCCAAPGVVAWQSLTNIGPVADASPYIVFDPMGPEEQRSYRVLQTPQVGSAPMIEQLRREGDFLIISFEVDPDVEYTVEYCDSLGVASWKKLTNVSPLPTRAEVNVRDIIGGPQKRFYRLGAAPVAELVQVETIRPGPQVRLSFTAKSGRRYTLECCDNLLSGVWTPLTNIGPESFDTKVVVSDPTSAQARRFYRLRSP